MANDKSENKTDQSKDDLDLSRTLSGLDDLMKSGDKKTVEFNDHIEGVSELLAQDGRPSSDSDQLTATVMSSAEEDPDQKLFQSVKSAAASSSNHPDDLLMQDVIRGTSADDQAAGPKEQAAYDFPSSQHEVHYSSAEDEMLGGFNDATVLFISIAGFAEQSVNKQIELEKQLNQLLSDTLARQARGERIVLDTDDGVVIGFVDHPEDVIQIAAFLRDTTAHNQLDDYLTLSFKIALSFGTIDLVQQEHLSTLVGDAVDEARALVKMARVNQIVVSEAYRNFLVSYDQSILQELGYIGNLPVAEGDPISVYELKSEFVQHDDSAGKPSAQSAQAAPETSSSQPEQEQESKQATSWADHFGVTDEHFMEDGSKQTEVTEETSHSVEQSVPESVMVEDVASDSAFSERDVMESVYGPRSSDYKQKPTDQQPAAETEHEDAELSLSDDGASGGKPMSHMPSPEMVTEFAQKEVKKWQQTQSVDMDKVKLSPAPEADGVGKKSKAKETAKKFKYRKPRPWGKMIGTTLAVALIAGVTAPFLVSWDGHAQKLEQHLSARMQQPVSVGNFELKIAPVPHFAVSDISVSNGALTVHQARLHFDWMTMLSSVKEVQTLEINGVQMQAAVVPQYAALLTRFGDDAEFPIRTVQIDNANITGAVIPLQKMTGRLQYAPDGTFDHALLQTGNKKYSLEVEPATIQQYGLTVLLQDATLPMLPSWKFSDLTIKGVLAGQEFLINALDGYIMGGKLEGDAVLNWQSGWRLTGNLIGKDMTLQGISPAISGNADGTARFQMRSTELNTLTENAQLQGTFAFRKGNINGIDMVETLKKRSGRNLPGGQTYFESLSGDFVVRNHVYAVRNMRMESDIVTASGDLNIKENQLNGKMAVRLHAGSSYKQGTLQITGPVSTPQLELKK